MPANGTLTNGVGTFTATLTDAATAAANFKINAVDTATPTIRGTSAAIAVSLVKGFAMLTLHGPHICN